jgi:probable phosphoglycerate mutase
VRLILIRHGETPSNVAGALDTARPGAALTGLGRRQAAALPPVLTTEPVVAVHASPLVRTQETAFPLARARGLDLLVTDGLEEIAAGELEMRTDEPAIEAYAEVIASWIRGDLGPIMPGAEDGYAFLERYDAAIRAITVDQPDDATVVAVSHGAAIRTYASRHGGPHDQRLCNTGAVVLQGGPQRGWTTVGWSGDPLGGKHLIDAAAADPTGDPDPV